MLDDWNSEYFIDLPKDDELDDGRHGSLGAHDARERVEPRIGYLDDPCIRLDGGEWVVRDQRLGGGEGVEEGGLADVRKADDTESQHS